MHILVTGMTSSQVPPSASTYDPKTTYASILVGALRDAGHTVEWRIPSILDERSAFDQYDSIVVGIAPITSLGANHAYGALSTIQRLLKDPRLMYFIDAPNPKQIRQSIRSVMSNSGSLVKLFYAARKGYDEAINPKTFERLFQAVMFLGLDEWPVTFWPMLPWHSGSMVFDLRNELTPNLVGLNLDAYAMNWLETGDKAGIVQEPIWTIDFQNDKWLKRNGGSLTLPVYLAKPSKAVKEPEVADAIADSRGFILPPQKSGHTWWSFRLLQSMSYGTPVATEWRESSSIGLAWNYLPYRIEEMDEIDRKQLAFHQRYSYLDSVPDVEATINYLNELLSVRKS